jgi:hypothetical protein
MIAFRSVPMVVGRCIGDDHGIHFCFHRLPVQIESWVMNYISHRPFGNALHVPLSVPVSIGAGEHWSMHAI